MATSKTSTASAPYNNVVVETVSGEIKAGPHNTNSANLKTAVQSHVHELEGKNGFDSMAADFRPPDTGDSTNRWRMVGGAVSLQFSGGTASALITFATDSDQGDPSFTTAPRITVTMSQTCDAVVFTDPPDTTTCMVRAGHRTDSGYALARPAHWIAYGKIA